MTDSKFEPGERAQASVVATSTRVQALEALIQSSLEELAAGNRPETADALLFIGNWNDALPRLLIHDPVLEPVDKIVWAVIKTCTDPRRGTAFPSYGTIARLANVSAEGTVARALSILRLTRWLTLCGRVRDRRGRFRGSVYALHDEPLPLADTLHLDNDYFGLAQRASRHAHARVRLVANSLIRSLEMDTAEGVDVEAATDVVVARIEAQRLIAQHDGMSAPPDPSRTPSSARGKLFSRSFALRSEMLPAPSPERGVRKGSRATMADQHQNLTVVSSSPAQGHRTEHPLQNLKVETDQNSRHENSMPQILKSTRSSSCSKETTTTGNRCTTQNSKSVEVGESRLANPQSTDPGADDQSLYRWPRWLSPNARHLALLELRKVPVASRQGLLDLLEQRHQDGERGAAKPLHSPVQYLRSLCQLANAGRITAQPDPPAPGSAATADPQTDTQIAHEHARQRLRAAEGDHRHWLRLISMTTDPERKAEWQDQADRAKAECEHYRAVCHATREMPTGT